MMPTMPSGLKPVVSNYSIDDPGGVMRTEVAGGMARYAMDCDRGSQRFNINLILDAFQFQVWTAFYHQVIKKGSITFDLNIDSGFGVSPHPVNIMPGSYSAVRTSGVMMVVSFVVETESQVYQLTAEGAQGLVDLYGAYGHYSASLLERLAQFSTVDTLVLA